MYSLQDKAPQRLRFGFGYEGPQQLTKEAISHEVFRFCAHYIERFHPEFQSPKHRVNIRNHISSYYTEIFSPQFLGKSTFVCHSLWDKEKGSLKVSFFSNRDIYFPFRWEYLKADGSLAFLEEDEEKLGRKDSFTRFHSDQCVESIQKDKNGIGGIDQWWIYDQCQLIRIEYDENENGLKERVCFFENGKQKNCEGIGEKEEKVARSFLERGESEKALQAFYFALGEYKKEFSSPTSRTCSLLREIISLEYAKENYPKFGKYLDEFLAIPICEKNSLEMLIYKAYYQLYISQKYKEAKKTYRKASEEYFRMNGEENPELILNLAFSQYKDEDPLSCLQSLERLREKRMLAVARFYFFYYRASCSLSLKKYEESIQDFQKALIKSQDQNYHALIYLKIAKSLYALSRFAEGEDFLIKSLSADIQLFAQVKEDPIFQSFLLSPAGQKFQSKYSLPKK
ncbi:hypothetical protein LPTSP4_07740 [Leptospira ryugenii]|uniref:Tetratricopeptide repeat protein n=1 Tax=Leptospira ryugenii TaxID=1917863 RepID=A0A2P2DXA0_9LEPT|nr:hypothetical protein LPTSP4_07740 [Leptospira ryugenii]